MCERDKKIYVICGPTGVGKTMVANELVSMMPSVVINMDMGQLYKPLTIGTAKPDWKNGPGEQRMFDVVERAEDYSVVRYKAAVTAVIEESFAGGKTPVLVGGSLFYLKSLLYPPMVGGVGAEDGSWEDLQKIDPVRAAAIHPHDTYRIRRALGLWRASGRLPSACKPVLATDYKWKILWVIREKKELDQMIGHRVVEMLQAGWAAEAEGIRGTEWEALVRRKHIIGYPELLDSNKLLNNVNNSETIINIINNTRQYAKRQMTYWRSLKRAVEADDVAGQIEINTWDLTIADVRLYLKQLCNDR
jgi:tRNA dimethylallyltransferase